MLPTERHGQPDEPVLCGLIPVEGHDWPEVVSTRPPGIVADGDEVGVISNCDSVHHGSDKEIVNCGSDGLQLDQARYTFLHTAKNNDAGLELADDLSGDRDKVLVDSPDATAKRDDWKRKGPLSKKRIIRAVAIAIALVLVVTAAVVGGVVGSRKSDGGNTSSADTDPATTTTLDSVREGSNLAVVAWRKNGGLNIFLYYQSHDGTLRSSTYDDTLSTFTYNGSYWGNSTNVTMDTSDTPANGTSLAAATLLWGTTYDARVELFYLDSDNMLRALYDVNDAVQYEADSVNNASIAAATVSSLGAYWPYCAYVDENNEVAVVGNDAYSAAKLSPSSSWTVTSYNKTAVAGSKLAVVPLVSYMEAIFAYGGIGVFYQDSDGNLAYTQPNRDAAAAAGTLVDSWPTDAEFPSPALAAGGSFAAFATARSDSIQGLVNTYVLYQEASSRISMVYLDNNSKWATVQPEALSSADSGTDIACLTMPMTQTDIDGEELDLEEASSHTNRCYFQRGGYIIEFVLSGTD